MVEIRCRTCKHRAALVLNHPAGPYLRFAVMGYRTKAGKAKALPRKKLLAFGELVGRMRDQDPARPNCPEHGRGTIGRADLERAAAEWDERARVPVQMFFDTVSVC